ncbi:hypothetical protein BRADI_3g57345v3 [Brachypodium distachyon]|uniref:Uncharacterized protein n=1 Tax=Brachypodium distachyon TaxID=15368 RepID=A0A0Q3MBH8_BRADI|nr:hypothetical protein BRADI_3g57345v3 [Brachypodium distachyon]
MDCCDFSLCNYLDMWLILQKERSRRNLKEGARRLKQDFSLFSIHQYSIYSDLHTSIEILDIDCRSLKRKKKRSNQM